MKNIKLAITFLILTAATTGLIAACSSSDTTTGAGPINKVDGGDVDGFVPTGNTDSGGNPIPDGGIVDDAGYNVCANGFIFDNTTVPGYPNLPQP